MIEVAGSLHILLPMGLFLVLMLLGLPIAFAMGIGGIVGLLGTFGPDATLGILTNVPMRTATNYMLTTVAAFVLMAELAGQSGITERLFAMADKFVGHLRGGLAMATIVASAVFGAISGSSLAAAATMSRIAVPQMLDAGYSKSFSAGTVGIAGTLAVLIPPSLVLIIYGILTETSISDLLLAGILPGLLTVAGHLVAIALWIRLRPEAAPGQRPRAGWKERAETAKTGWPFMLVIGLVFTGLYSGVFTATEAGAMGAGATFVVWCLGQGRRRGGLAPLGQGNLFRAIDRSLRTTAMLVSLLIGAYIFSYFIVSTACHRPSSRRWRGPSSTAMCCWSRSWPSSWSWACSSASWRSWC